MAQHDLLKLATQGRAFDATRPWTEKELLSLEALVNHGLTRVVAAEYIRNGITSVDMYEAAQKAGFTPKSLDDLRTEVIAAHQKDVRDQLGFKEEAKKEAKAEVVPETAPVAEEAKVSEPEVVPETAPVAEEAKVSEPEAEAKSETSTEAKDSGKAGGRGNSRGNK